MTFGFVHYDLHRESVYGKPVLNCKERFIAMMNGVDVPAKKTYAVLPPAYIPKMDDAANLAMLKFGVNKTFSLEQAFIKSMLKARRSIKDHALVVYLCRKPKQRNSFLPISVAHYATNDLAQAVRHATTAIRIADWHRTSVFQGRLCCDRLRSHQRTSCRPIPTTNIAHSSGHLPPHRDSLMGSYTYQPSRASDTFPEHNICPERLEEDTDMCAWGQNYGQPCRRRGQSKGR